MTTKPLLIAKKYRSLISRVAALFVLLWLTMLMSGCNMVAWLAQAGREDEKVIQVPAEYTDLQDKRVAVMTSADEYTLFRFPRSTFRVSETVSRAIQNNVEGVAVSLPKEVDAYQRKNPYWITSRPGRMIDELGVDRLIIIDLNEYRTNEAGNAEVWRGVIDATVSVYEADGEDPDNRTFEKQVRVEYPEDSTFGMINSSADEAKIEVAALQLFARRGAGLFFDHEDVVRR